MTKIDKIITLVEQGYTKAEIDAMLTPDDVAEVEEQAAPETPAAVEAPAAVEETAAEPDRVDALESSMKDFMEEVNKSMRDLTAAVQSSNRLFNSVDTTEAEEMDKVLAQFINPPGR